MFQHGDLVLRQKRLDRQGLVCLRVVLVKNPFHSSGLLLTRLWRFVKTWLTVLSSGTKSTWTIPRMSRKTIIIALDLDLLCRAFFCLGELGLHCMDCRLLCVSYWKKPWFITSYYVLYNVWVVFNALKNVSTNINSNFLLFRSEESRHHLRAHFFSCWNCYVKVCRTVSFSMSINPYPANVEYMVSS